MVIDAPNAHAVDDAMVDLGLAVWNTATIHPVITLEEAVGAYPNDRYLHLVRYLGSWSLIHQRNGYGYPRHAAGNPRRVALTG